MIEQMTIQLGARGCSPPMMIEKVWGKKSKHSGGVGGGGSGSPPMMIENVIQLGAKKSKKQRGGWGGQPCMMIEKVTVQLGEKVYK